MLMGLATEEDTKRSKGGWEAPDRHAGGKAQRSSSPDYRKSEVAAKTALERQLNPQHGVSFEETGVPQWPSVYYLEAERSHQLDDPRLIRCIVAGHEHH